MKDNANEGLKKVSWFFVGTIVVLMALAAVYWWYDGYLIHELHTHTHGK